MTASNEGPKTQFLNWSIPISTCRLRLKPDDLIPGLAPTHISVSTAGTQQDSSLLALEDCQVKPRVTYMPYFMAPRTVEPTNHYDDNDLKR